MSRYKSYGKGWHFEGYRHSLAAKGIKTRLSFQAEDPEREKRIAEFIRREKLLLPEERSRLTDWPIGSWQREAKARLLRETEIAQKQTSKGISGPSTHRTDVILVGGKEVTDVQGITHKIPGKAIPKKRINQFYDEYVKKMLMKKLSKEEEADLRKFMVEQGRQLTKKAKGADLTAEEEAEIEQNVDERIAAAKLQFGKVVDDVKAMDGWLDAVDVSSDTFEDQLKDARARIATVMEQRGTIIPGQEVTRLREKIKEIVERRAVYKKGLPEKWPFD